MTGKPTFIPIRQSLFRPMCRDAILEQTGDHLFHRFNASLAYDTRNSVELPNGGQRTEFDPEFVTGDSTYYKLELKTAWYFPRFVQESRHRSERTRGLCGRFGQRRCAVL